MFSCAECGTTEATTYVVTTLDPESPEETTTEVCLPCHDALRETFVLRIYDPAGEHDTVHVATDADCYLHAQQAADDIEDMTGGLVEAVVEHVYADVNAALARHFTGSD